MPNQIVDAYPSRPHGAVGQGADAAENFAMPISHDAIVDIVVAETGLAPEKLRPDATLAELDIASLDLVSIAFEIEDRFGVEVSTDELKADMTVGALIDYLQALGPA